MTTILVSVLLLLIITMIVLFSSAVSIKEVRTGTNQFRSTRAFDVAQEGVNLGLEYVRANRSVAASSGIGGWLEPDLAHWERCPADGVVADDFPCDAIRDATRRGNMFRYRGPLTLPLAQRYRFPLPQPAGMPAIDINGDGTAETSEAALRYRVGGLLCLMVPTVAAGGNPDCPGTNPVDCTALGGVGSPSETCVVDSAQAYAIQLVSRGAVMSADAAATALPEALNSGVSLAEARATVTNLYGSFRLISDGPEAPLIAANSVTMRGTFDIVPNPNAGGFGIPISIWTASVIDPNGTPKSCHIQEFLSSAQQASDVVVMDGVYTCDSCSCPREGSISYKDGGDFIKGNDIIDATGNTQVTGQGNFPTDVFAYMFGVPKVDAAGNARWTEVRDRATLLTGVGCTSNPLTPKCCSDLGVASTGLFWSTETDCAITADQVGTPRFPVMLVAEKGFTESADAFFGVIYKFARPGDTNTYQLRVNGSGVIYGALVADTNSVVDKATGNFALVYSAEVMRNLVESPGLLKLGPLPGTWTDLGTY